MAVSLKWPCLNAVVIEAAGSVTRRKAMDLGRWDTPAVPALGRQRREECI